MSRLFHYLYTSTTVAEISPQWIGGVVRSSRVKNSAAGITGMLVFDGWRLCQYLEGGASEILSLVDIIQQDPRHHSLVAVHQGHRDGARRFPDEPLLYGMLYDERPLAALETMRGPQALEVFDRIVPTLDVCAQ